MKVILLADVKGQGKKDAIINVSDGYANNFLLKNKLAVPYTEGSKKILDKEIKSREDAENKLVESYNLLKQKLENQIIEFKVKTGKDDKVFGTISSKQISDYLHQKGFNINKKCIFIDSPIDSLGTHNVLIKLHKKVEFKIRVKLVK